MAFQLQIQESGLWMCWLFGLFETVCYLLRLCVYLYEGCECGFSRFLNRSKTLDKRYTKQGVAPLIDYSAIEKGTNGFNESNILGRGGFGCVYLATLDNNVQAAVKKLDCDNDEAAKEFKVQ